MDIEFHPLALSDEILMEKDKTPATSFVAGVGAADYSNTTHHSELIG